MGGKDGNFDFLEKHSPQLAKLGRLAERYYADDPPTALVKMRQFAEMAAKQVAARHALYDDARMSFDDVLRALRSRSVLQREIADLFYHLKRTGNLAAPAGAWIETVVVVVGVSSSAVAPRAGAWIETRRRC